MSIANDKIVNLQDVKVLYDDLRGRIKEQHTYEKSITESSAIQSFEGGAWPMRLQVAVDPVQDLHGYDHPWPGGGGKNMMDISPEKLKSYAVNSASYWTGDTFTYNGITMTAKKDKDGNTLAWIANGTATNSVRFTVYVGETDDQTYIVSGFGNGKKGGCAYTTETGAYKAYIPTVTTDNASITPATGTYDYFRIAIAYDSGDVASNDEYELMLRPASVLDSTFEPYSNICHITGWTGVEVTRTGKNLLPVTLEKLKQENTSGTWSGNTYTYSGLSFQVNTDSDGTVSDVYISGATGAYPTLNVGFNLPAGNYIASDIHRYRIFKNGERIYNSSGNFEFTVDSITDEFRFAIIDTGTIDGYTRSTPMVRLATDQDETYEPYNGKVYPITFPTSAGTVYGGMLSVNKDGTGTLVVDRKCYNLDGSSDETWWVNSETGYKFASTYVTAFNVDKRSLAISNELPVTQIATTNSAIGVWLVNNTELRLRYEMLTSLTTSDVRTWLSNNNLQVVYYLATPITYTLTPGQVLSLLGQNNVWADTGDILSLTYNSKQGIEFIREDTAGQINTVVDPVKTELADAEAAMAIIIDGDTSPSIITAGKYVFLKNHSTLASGLYHTTAYINSGDTISASNVASDADGGFNAMQEKIGAVGSTDLQTQVTALNSNLNSMFTRKYRTYTNITFPSSEYIKVDSFSEMGISTNLYVVSITIRGWTGNINGVTIGKGTNGEDFYLIGAANKTITSITVEYTFSRY